MWLLVSSLSLACAIVLHGVLCRIDMPLDRVVRFLIVGSIVGCALVAAAAGAYGLQAPETWAALLGYAFACELYIFLFTFTISSISANLLMSLQRQRLTVEAVDRIYDSREMVAQRVERLQAGGFLSTRGSDLTVSRKGLLFSRVLTGLRRFFRHS